jgi:hypothetical protein
LKHPLQEQPKVIIDELPEALRIADAIAKGAAGGSRRKSRGVPFDGRELEAGLLHHGFEVTMRGQPDLQAGGLQALAKSHEGLHVTARPGANDRATHGVER